MKKLPSLLGGEAFCEWIKTKYSHLGLQQEVPEAQILALAPTEIIQQVCSYFNLDEVTLKNPDVVLKTCHVTLQFICLVAIVERA